MRPRVYMGQFMRNTYLPPCPQLGHSWKHDDAPGGVNNHTYHHTLHDKNFGIFGITLDLCATFEPAPRPSPCAGAFVLRHR